MASLLLLPNAFSLLVLFVGQNCWLKISLEDCCCWLWDAGGETDAERFVAPGDD